MLYNPDTNKLYRNVGQLRNDIKGVLFPSDIEKIDDKAIKHIKESKDVTLIKINKVADIDPWQTRTDQFSVHGSTVSYKAKDVDVESLRTKKLARLKDYRDTVMAKGVEIDNVIVDTDPRSQAAITSTMVLFQTLGENAPATVNWKGQNGYITANLAKLAEIGVTMGLHVQSCYDAEKSHKEKISRLTSAKEVYQYDLTTDWPTT